MVGLAYLGVVFWLAIYEASHEHPTSFYSTEPLLPLATPSKSKVLEKLVYSKNLIEESSKRKSQHLIENLKSRSGNKDTHILRKYGHVLSKEYNLEKRSSDSLMSSLEFTPSDKIKATMEAREYEKEYRKERKKRKKSKSRKLEQQLLQIYEDYKISTLPKPGGK